MTDERWIEAAMRHEFFEAQGEGDTTPMAAAVRRAQEVVA